MAKSKHIYFVILAAVGAVASTVGVGLALASSSQHTRYVGGAASLPPKLSRQIADRAFAVLRHKAHSAHISAVASSQSPSGGIVALTTPGLAVRVYEAGGNVCLMTEATEGAFGGSCDHSQVAAEKGIIEITRGVDQPTRVTVLVPNGVSTVVANTAGSAVRLPVTNNVATAVVGQLRSVTYNVPGNSQIGTQANEVSWVPPAPSTLPVAH